jgi:hypothetical protein
MLMTALNDKTQGKRGRISDTRSLVAPIKGWWVGSPLAAAPPATAFLLENAFPELDYIRARSGAQQFATGMSGNVSTLMPYTNGVTVKMFAYNSGNIYDVSVAGSVGAPLVTGLNPGVIMSYVQYSGTGPQTLVCSNGIDPLQFYNGSTWSTGPAWTGLTGAQISYVWEYNQRLYGIENGTTNVWYPAVDAIGGAVTIFPLGPLLRYGGRLVAGGTWNQLTSNGIQYTWFVISSEGEVVMFTGAFPGDPSTWKQAGCYKVGRPLGQNCIQPAGADVALLTEDGIVALSQVLTLDQIALANEAVTRNIAPAFRDAVIARAGRTGWQMLLWPLRSMAIINMPQIGPPNTQFISNARTGAWCRYTGWDAQCFAVYGLDPSGLYFGTSDGRVMQAETGGQDDGKLYGVTIFFSYTDLSGQDVSFGGVAPSSASQSVSRKHISMIRTRFQTNINALSPKVTINVEYDTAVPPLPSAATALATGSNWNSAKWDTDVWGGLTVSHTQNWIPTYADASQLAPIIQLALNTPSTPDVRLTSVDVLFETGSIFG